MAPNTITKNIVIQESITTKLHVVCWKRVKEVFTIIFITMAITSISVYLIAYEHRNFLGLLFYSARAQHVMAA